MSVVMAIMSVSRCAITPKDHTIVYVLMAMNSLVMAIHVMVSVSALAVGIKGITF